MQKHSTKRCRIRMRRRRMLACLSQLGCIQGLLGGVLTGYGSAQGAMWAPFCGLLMIELLRQTLVWHDDLWVVQKTAWMGLLAGMSCIIPTLLTRLSVSAGYVDAVVAETGTTVSIGPLLIVGACLGSQQATDPAPYNWTPFGLGLIVGLGFAVTEDSALLHARLIGLSLACLGLLITEILIGRLSAKQKEPRWLRKETGLPVRTLTPD